MTATTHQPSSTIDVAESAREIERAVEMFARGERPQAISNLHLAVELIMVAVPNSTRLEAERAVCNEFLIRTKSKIDRVHDAAGILREAREQLEQEFPTA